jgi:hypothetical protein
MHQHPNVMLLHWDDAALYSIANKTYEKKNGNGQPSSSLV